MYPHAFCKEAGSYAATAPGSWRHAVGQQKQLGSGWGGERAPHYFLSLPATAKQKPCNTTTISLLL